MGGLSPPEPPVATGLCPHGASLSVTLNKFFPISQCSSISIHCILAALLFRMKFKNLLSAFV